MGAGGRAWTSPPGRVCDPVLMQNRADAQLHAWGTCCTAGSTPASSCHLLALCQPKSGLAPLPVPLAGPTAPRDTDLRLLVAREGAPLSGRLPSRPGSRPVSLWRVFSWAIRLLPSRSNKSFVSSLRAARPRAPVFPAPSAGPDSDEAKPGPVSRQTTSVGCETRRRWPRSRRPAAAQGSSAPLCVQEADPLRL